VARAEVVERELDPDRAERVEDVERSRRVAHDRPLADLERHGGRVGVVLVEQRRNGRREPGVHHRGAGEVDGDRHLDPGGGPRALRTQRLVEHVQGERADQLVSSAAGTNSPGTEQAAGRMLPAHERLHPGRRAAR
jgi:hypothetical protein